MNELSEPGGRRSAKPTAPGKAAREAETPAREARGGEGARRSQDRHAPDVARREAGRGSRDESPQRARREEGAGEARRTSRSDQAAPADAPGENGPAERGEQPGADERSVEEASGKGVEPRRGAGGASDRGEDGAAPEGQVALAEGAAAQPPAAAVAAPVLAATGTLATAAPPGGPARTAADASPAPQAVSAVAADAGSGGAPFDSGAGAGFGGFDQDDAPAEAELASLARRVVASAGESRAAFHVHDSVTPGAATGASPAGATAATGTAAAAAPAEVPGGFLEARLADVERAAAILDQVRVHLRSEVGEATLQLEPESLGRMRIRVSVQDGRLTAEFRVERPEALAALERHVPELRAALADSGIDAERVDLQLGFDDGDDRAGRDGAPRGRSSRGEGRDGAAGVSAWSPAALRDRLARHVTDRGVDTYA